jgi:hypothetical protein
MGSKRLTKEQVFLKLGEIHPELSFPSALEDFNTVGDYTTVICDIHGESRKSFENLLYNKTGCKLCGAVRANSRNLKYFSEFKGSEKVLEKYELLDRGRMYLRSKVSLLCPRHGEFSLCVKDATLGGQGCPRCGREKAGLKCRKSITQRLEQSDIPEKYVVLTKDIATAHDTIEVSCSVHGIFKTNANNFFNNGHGCPKCSKSQSKGETSLFEFVQSLCPDAVQGRRFGNLQADIFVPSKQVVIEFNGIRWHSSAFKEKYYHREKREHFESLGLRCIMVWEDEPLEKVRSYLSTTLGFFQRVHGRKCQTLQVSQEEGSSFIEKHHLMGEGKKSPLYVGLYFEGELVGCASFRKNFKLLELYRVAYKSGFRVLGGLSKMISYWKKNHWDGESELVSYIDLDKFQGESYYKAGFKYVHETLSMSYFYRSGRVSRHKLKKKTLVELPHYSDKLTEEEILSKSGVYSCWNSGTVKVVLSNG